MKKIEIIENSSDFQIFDILLEQPDETITDSAKEFTKKNKSPFLKYLVSGTLLLVSPYQTVLSNPIPFTESIENIENFLNQYKESVDKPISDFVQDVRYVSNCPKHSKMGIIKEIVAYKSLKNSWDGFGAYPLEVESAVNAISLIDLVGDDLFCTVNEFFPNPNGTISFVWSNNSDETISLEVGNHTISYFVELSSKDPVFFNDKKINAKEAKKISEFIKLL